MNQLSEEEFKQHVMTMRADHDWYESRRLAETTVFEKKIQRYKAFAYFAVFLSVMKFLEYVKLCFTSKHLGIDIYWTLVFGILAIIVFFSVRSIDRQK